jgi:hypothetical protein
MLTRAGSTNSFAVVSCWPNLKNAEYEVVERLKSAAHSIGWTCLVINNAGYAIDGSGFVDGRVEFCISLHYSTAKAWNTFTYYTIWNPIKYYHEFGYADARNNILSCDDYLSYNSEPLRSQLQHLLGGRKKQGKNNYISFVAGCAGDLLPPHDNFIAGFSLFYCGINWERGSKKHGRHHELFKLLDKTGVVKFFGPKKFCGFRPWAGYENYSGEIPFDGVTLLEIINECGVALVLSSDEHRRFHCVSSRLYESIAAGALIISDNNQFVIDNFAGCVLFFEYTDNHLANCQAIMAEIEWIRENPSEAKAMVVSAQEIYKARFALEVQLENVIISHVDKLTANVVTCCKCAVYYLVSNQLDYESLFNRVIPDLACMQSVAVKLCVICNQKFDIGSIKELCSKLEVDCNIQTFSDQFGMWKSFGMSVINEEYEYFTLLGAGETVLGHNLDKCISAGSGFDVIVSGRAVVSDVADKSGFIPVRVNTLVDCGVNVDEMDQNPIQFTASCVVKTSTFREEYDIDSIINIGGYLLNSIIYSCKYGKLSSFVSDITTVRAATNRNTFLISLEDKYGYCGFHDFVSNRYPLVVLRGSFKHKKTVKDAAYVFLKYNYPRILPIAMYIFRRVKFIFK